LIGGNKQQKGEKIMSRFSNDGYAPLDIDFNEWVEFIEARDEALNYQDYMEDMGFEDEELDSEEDLELSITEKEMDDVLKKVEKMTGSVAESMAGLPKETKLEVLSEMLSQTEAKLLYLHLKKNDTLSTEFIFKSETYSSAEEDKKIMTFTNINRILKTKKFDVKNEKLMGFLKFYRDVLKNEDWAESQDKAFKKWKKSLGGNVHAVYSKTLDKKLQEMKEAVIKEPEQTMKKPKRDFAWDH